MYEIYCELRDARGMKDADVARETGITKSTFSDWKNGRSNPKDAKLQKIADLFGVSVEYIRTGKEKEGGEKYYLNEETAEMAQALFENKDLRVLSGLRFGEFAALKAEDVDIKGQIIHVSMTYDPNNKVETTAKTYESRRDVYMQDELLSVAKELRLLMLRQRMMHGYSTDLYVCAEDGSHVKYYTYNKYLQEISQRIIGRKITPHTLRHTHASLLMEQGIGIDTISRRLGHSDSKVTKEIYLHVTERLREKENEQIKGLKII